MVALNTISLVVAKYMTEGCATAAKKEGLE
jgi:hypothetical protein